MNLQLFVLNSLSVFLSLITFFLLKSYWPKYFEAKGANQATKEDIGEITDIVENIKSNLLQQNELLKAQLSLNNQHKLNLKTAEREAIFDFNKCLFARVYTLLRFSPSSYDLDNFREIKLLSSELNKRQYEYDLAEAHLMLFMNRKEFIILNSNINKSILQLEIIVKHYMNDTQYTYQKGELSIRYAQTDHNKEMEAREELRKEIMTHMDNYGEKTLEQYGKVHALSLNLRDMINERLRELEKFENMLT